MPETPNNCPKPQCPFNAYIEKLNSDNPDKARKIRGTVCGDCIRSAINERELERLRNEFLESSSRNNTPTAS